jgi:hypothetical protein
VSACTALTQSSENLASSVATSVTPTAAAKKSEVFSTDRLLPAATKLSIVSFVRYTVAAGKRPSTINKQAHTDVQYGTTPNIIFRVRTHILVW